MRGGGSLDLARQLIERALRDDPYSTELWWNLSVAARLQGDDKTKMLALETAYKLDPASPLITNTWNGIKDP
jgi:cytochrome c-type biogenesis protein CcmH/NrfG